MDNRLTIEVIDGSHETVLEFLLGCDADMAEHRAGELGEEAFDEIEPGAVLGCEHELEAPRGLLSEPAAASLRGWAVGADAFARDLRGCATSPWASAEAVPATRVGGPAFFRAST